LRKREGKKKKKKKEGGKVKDREEEDGEETRNDCRQGLEPCAKICSVFFFFCVSGFPLDLCLTRYLEREKKIRGGFKKKIKNCSVLCFGRRECCNEVDSLRMRTSAYYYTLIL
jgi:hypothetical protein